YLAWLRKMLIHNLADALRAFRQSKRAVAREQAIEEALQNSSARLVAALADSGPEAAEQAMRHERAVRLADALEQLPERQREALVCKHWHGWPVRRIARHLECSEEAVAGLLKRALKELRELLHGWE